MTPSVDIHTHLIPPLAADRAAAMGFTIVDGRPGHGAPIGPADLYRPGRLAEWLGAARVDRALVSVPPPVYAQGHEPSATRAWAMALNDGLRAIVAAWNQLEPIGYLPLDQPEVALDELERLIAGGWSAVTACAGGRSLPLHSPRLRPLWIRLAGSGLPIVLHPGASPDPRLSEFYLENLLGNPQESTLAVGQLLFGRVLRDTPRLRVAVVHGGGLVPAVAGRWQRGVDTARPGLDDPGLRVGEELRGSIWVDCLTHDSASLELAVSWFGPDRILLGSDWPFPMGSQDPRALVAYRGGEFAQRVAEHNAAAFLTRAR